MSWLKNAIASSLGRKLIMALTGIFLILFLVVHLVGNLQLLKNDGGHSFNAYAEFMSTNPLVQFISKGNFALILIHVFLSLYLTMKNRKARGPVGYKMNDQSESSLWSSRNMGILGTVILIFLIIHLRSFWFEMHYGSVQKINYDGEEYRNLYQVTSFAFSKLWYTVLYVFSMIAMAFHLSHGFQSAFQTLGLRHVKYSPGIKFTGIAFSILIPALYALIPIWMYIESLS
jgi:succinate dehydrogenase cytochrome b subunit